MLVAVSTPNRIDCSANILSEGGVTLSKNWLQMDTLKESIIWSLVFLLAAKDFSKTPEVDAARDVLHPGFIGWLPMLSWMVRYLYDVLKITSELQDLVRAALQSPPKLKTSLIMCISGVNFGTVSCLWNTRDNIANYVLYCSSIYISLVWGCVNEKVSVKIQCIFTIHITYGQTNE